MKFKKLLVTILSVLILTGCASYEVKTDDQGNMVLSESTLISDVIKYREFEGFGKLLFPNNIDNTYTVDDLKYALKYDSNYSPDKTLEIINYLKDQANQGRKVFYNIYSEEEMNANPELRDVGIIYFRGNSDKPFTIHMAGGWEYVGSIHDSMPQSLELAKLGFNSFALIYRNNNNAINDLDKAIKYIIDNKEELNITNTEYSVWANGQASIVADTYAQNTPTKPTALVMQYNNVTTVTGNEVPTYSVVGTSDQVIDYNAMNNRNTKLKAKGIPAEIKMYVGLEHGFGLGTNTAADGWINDAIIFINKLK